MEPKAVVRRPTCIWSSPAASAATRAGAGALDGGDGVLSSISCVLGRAVGSADFVSGNGGEAAASPATNGFVETSFVASCAAGIWGAESGSSVAGAGFGSDVLGDSDTLGVEELVSDVLL